jgi:hypothetical protein
VQRVLAELEAEQLVVRHGTTYRCGASSAMHAATSGLSALYHSRPVTLVQAIYARPSRMSSVGGVVRPPPAE